MYSPESKFLDRDLRTPIMLCGYKMELVMGTHACNRIHQRTQNSTTDVLYRIALLLENPSISEYITMDVAIGSDCVILDGDTGCSYALAVEESEVVVKTVYAPQKSTDVKKVGQREFCMYVKKSEVVCADMFCNIQPLIYNLMMGLVCPTATDYNKGTLASPHLTP